MEDLTYFIEFQEDKRQNMNKNRTNVEPEDDLTKQTAGNDPALQRTHELLTKMETFG